MTRNRRAALGGSTCPILAAYVCETILVLRLSRYLRLQFPRAWIFARGPPTLPPSILHRVITTILLLCRH